MTVFPTLDRRRCASIGGVVLVHAVFAFVLLSGLAPRIAAVREEGLATFAVLPPRPPRLITTEPVTARTPEPEAEAAPPALRADPRPVTAPKPIVPPPLPVPAPPKAAQGAAIMAGAAPVPGPGTGAGGVGDGLGSGTSGSGTGGGGGTSATLVRGAIVNRDYPGDARRAKLGGTVTVGFTVHPMVARRGVR